MSIRPTSGYRSEIEASAMATYLTLTERRQLIEGLQVRWAEDGSTIDLMAQDDFWRFIAELAVDYMVEEIGERIVKY